VNAICFCKDSTANTQRNVISDGKRRAEENVGDCGIIVLEGQAGMGKSAFVSKAKKLGKGRIKIAWTAAFSLEQENDFFVFRHLIESYTGLRRDMTKEQLKRTCEEQGNGEEELNLDVLGEVIPWIKDTLRSNNGGLVAMNTGPARSAGSSSVSEFDSVLIEKIGKEVIKIFMGFRGELTLNQILAGEPSNGALLIIEDVQWMDMPSFNLLRYLLENISLMQGVVFMLTTRTDAKLFRTPSFNDFTQDGNAIHHQRSLAIDVIMDLAKNGPKAALTILLHGLTKQDCNKLVARLLEAKDEDEGVTKDVLEFVFEKTDGFPMYVVLLLEWIRDHQLITLNENGILDWSNPSVPQTAKFPNTLADTMLARFDRLDVQTRNLLKIASAMGGEFDVITLTTLANIDLGKNNALSEEKVLDSLRNAQQIGVVSVMKAKGIKASAHKWRFKHDTMLEAVQSIIPTERSNQLKALMKPMRQEVEKKKLVPLFAGFLGEVDD